MAATLTSDNELTWASFPIEKVEETADGNVMVWGKATDDSVDSDQQIVDPDFAAKGIAEWLETGPNLRVQHQAQRDPAGVGVSMERDGSAHWVKSKVIEPVAKQLVLGGALRAYSVGIARPTIVRDSVARGGRITDGTIVEISLVDRPANKNCGIQLVKADKDGFPEFTGKVFGSDDVLVKSGLSVPSDVTITFPSDVQMTFSPLDMAKIVARKNSNGNGMITKDVSFVHGGAVPAGSMPKGDDAHPADCKCGCMKDVSFVHGGGVPAGSMPKCDDDMDDDDVKKGKLTTDARNKLPDSDFVFPETRKYPIHDKNHARNALSRVEQNGTPEEQAKVRAAVARRYPGIGKKTAAKAAAKVGAALAAEPDVTKPVEKKDKVLCTSCGAKQHDAHKFCTECGNSMAGAPPVMKNHDFQCLGCGHDLDKGERHCPECGKENPGYNPMADQKIPANKAERGRVADQPTDTTETAPEPVVKAKKKGGKGKPFGGNQAAPFGKDKDGDADDAKKTADAPVTAPPKAEDDAPVRKGKKLGGKTSGAITVSTDAPGRRGKAKKAKTPSMSQTPGSGTEEAHPQHPVPGHRAADTNQEFNRDMAKSADPAVAAAMRLKSLGVSQDMGYAHDLTCPAYSWDQVEKAYPAGWGDFSADSWQQKALEAASSAPLPQAQAASRLGQAAFTIKSAALNDLVDVKSDLYKAFRDANPGPSTFPTPGDVHPQSFQRPNITTGHAAYSHQYGAPHSAAVPTQHPAASMFDRGFLQDGRAEDSPANKSGAPYPTEPGKHVNLDYSSIQKEQVLQAFKAMHDHFDRVFPGVCPMNQTGGASAHPLAAVKADDGVVTKKVSSDGMSKKNRRKLEKKLTRKVMKGKMPLDQARIRMGKKPKTSPEPLKPQKSVQPDVIKTVKAPSKTDLFATELRKSQKTTAKQIAALTKAVNALADQPDPGTQAFKGMAVNPVRAKSVGPAGVQTVAEVAERTQTLMAHSLEDQWRNSTDSATREAAWNALLKMRGLPSGS